MNAALLLHNQPACVGEYFPGYRAQAPDLDLPADIDRCVYFPGWLPGLRPDLVSARAMVARVGNRQPRRMILVSSALIYGACYRNPGLMSESRVLAPRLMSVISKTWQELEQLFHRVFQGNLVVLRTAPCPMLEPDSLFGAQLEARRIPRFRLFDPP